jgi:hypothetical protein
VTTYSIPITNGYIPPEGPFDTNKIYLTFVNNRAAESYMNQYSTANVEDGITAARQAYNATLPIQPVEPENDA